MPSFQPYWGKPAVRNDRGDRGDVGIIRSPVRASILPDCGGRSVMDVPTAIQSRTFVIDELEGFRVEFLLGPDGKVDEMFFHQPNGTFVGRRA